MASKCAKLSKTRFMVEKFDGKSNFGLWQVQVRDILIQQGLHKALKGIKGKPADMSDEDWKEYDLQAGSTIRLCLSKEIICNVMREYSAASLWAKLESLYITKSPTGRLYLKKQLYKLRKAEGTSLADHLNEFNRIISELLNVGEVVGDEDKALILLSSLPNSYERLVSSLLYRRETIELDFVTAALLSNESRKKTASSDSEADGFLGRGGIERRKSGKCRSETIGKSKNKKVKYGECHEKGHAKKRKKNLSFPAMKQPGSVAGQKTARKCMHCEITKTPQWRAGPMGPKTLCNACGVRYRSGRLYPEYRPAASPTFIASLHSNSHNKVIEMRNMSEQKDPVPVAQFENSNPGKAPVPQFASSNLGNAPVFVHLFDDDNLGKPPEAQFASSNLGDFPPFVPPFEDEDLGKPSVPQFASSNLSNVPVFVPQFEDSNFGNAGNLGLHDLKCKVEPMG